MYLYVCVYVGEMLKQSISIASQTLGGKVCTLLLSVLHSWNVIKFCGVEAAGEFRNCVE